MRRHVSVQGIPDVMMVSAIPRLEGSALWPTYSVTPVFNEILTSMYKDVIEVASVIVTVTYIIL